MKVVVTGKVAGESRLTAEQKLREAGHEVQSSVGATTELLLTGERVGSSKLRKARALGVDVKPWDAFWRGSASAEAWEEVMPEDGDDVEILDGRFVGPDGEEEILVPDGSGKLEWQPARPAPSVRQIGPMLAKAEPLPLGDDWLYEVKFDGWRCVATVVDGQVRMQSRSGKTELSTSYPLIAEALSKLPNCVIDGELVSPDENGNDVGLSNARPAVYIVWDALEYDGYDLRGQTLVERKRILTQMILHSENAQLQISPTFDDGEALLDWCAENGREGLVAKRRSGLYVEGHRGWVKVKCRNQQEFVIVGWTPGKESNAGRIGGVLLAYYDDGDLVYVGRCGTNPSGDAVLATMTARETSPLASAPKKLPKDVTWVEPELVLEVLFQRWTEDEILWHPIWKGLRDDKDPKQVTRDA